jgi:hypothetical protein
MNQYEKEDLKKVTIELDSDNNYIVDLGVPNSRLRTALSPRSLFKLMSEHFEMDLQPEQKRLLEMFGNKQLSISEPVLIHSEESFIKRMRMTIEGDVAE